MKITLLKDLELYGVRHLAGEEVDVEQSVYDFIMQSIVADRIAERVELAKLEENVQIKPRGRK